MAKPAADTRTPGLLEFAVKVKPIYPDVFQPIGVSFVGLARVGADVQMDLGQVNIKRVTERIEQMRAAGKMPAELQVEMAVAVSAYLTPSAFIHLYREVNRFYSEMKKSGHILDDDEKEAK